MLAIPHCRFITCFVTVFATVIALTKDLPDVVGDRQHGIQTFATMLGAPRLTALGVCGPTASLRCTTVMQSDASLRGKWGARLHLMYLPTRHPDLPHHARRPRLTVLGLRVHAIVPGCTFASGFAVSLIAYHGHTQDGDRSVSISKPTVSAA